MYINCADCDFGSYDKNELVQHLLSDHSETYTPDNAKSYVDVWENDALEAEEAEDIYRTEYYKRHGVDPYDLPCDKDPL